MSDDLLAQVDMLLEGADEPDDGLRETVAALAEWPGHAWAGVAFSEGEELVLGPEAGVADPSRRARVPVVWQGAMVGELWVDGDVDRGLLERVADHLAAHVLLGWDTGGEAWEP